MQIEAHYICSIRKRTFYGLELVMPLNKNSSNVDQGLVGQCYSTKSTINVKDAYRSSHFNSTIDKITGYHTKSVLCIPIVNIDDERTCLGVLQLLNKNDGQDEFSSLDETLMND